MFQQVSTLVYLGKPRRIALSISLVAGVVCALFVIDLFYFSPLPVIAHVPTRPAIGDSLADGRLIYPTIPPQLLEGKIVSTTRPLRVGASIMAANLISRVQPIYSPLALSAGVKGSVQFTATVNGEGQVVNLRLVRGHPLLVNAAKDVVLQWRYKPVLLNGKPVDVETTISVNFKLPK